MAVAIWLFSALAAGYGVASADTGSDSSGAASSSASSSDSAGGGGAASAHSGRRATGGVKPHATSGKSAAGQVTSGGGSKSSTPPPTRTAAATSPSPVSAAVAESKIARPTAAVTDTRSTSVVQPTTGTAHAALAIHPTAAAVNAKATPNAAAPAGPVDFLNHVITSLLNPFLNPPPDTPGPLVPLVWSVLGAVRRDLFNQAPTISDPTTTVQTGQTVTGSIGATDIEGDALKYTVTQGPRYGTLTIDQVTGNYTYTPDDINYTAAQTDSFTVTVSDGKFNILTPLSSHSAQASEGVTVLNPTVQRAILAMPAGVTKPVNPRYSEDGQSIYFAATPAAGGRQEIYQINIDGTNATCLTCGVAPSVTANLGKPVPFTDGSGRVVVLVDSGAQSGPTYSVLQQGDSGAELIPIVTPAGAPGVISINAQRELRISPDGQHVLFSRIMLNGATGVLQIVPVVGGLEYNAATNTYDVTDPRVVFPTGEGKQWTPDGKGVVILGGSYEQGNADDIVVDLATGGITRVTANLDYDEDMDYSPNQQWIAIGSTRGLNALTPMTRIVRQSLLPVYVAAPVYGYYATPVNVSNQEWAVAVGDELNRENGIPLFDTGDGWAARSMPSWNTDGTAVTFWESSVSDPTKSRLVIANLKYTTSVGPAAADRTTPDSSSWAPALSTYHPSTTPLDPVGSYNGVGGGTAVVTEAPDSANPGRTIRTVTYNNYVNEDGMILNGTESADYLPNQSSVHYLANITVTGAHTGYLHADATINAFQQTLTGYIVSNVDGDIEGLPDPARAADSQQSA
ncbi:Ig-like domain-containing protein [Mycobacterium sp. EPa45]|uniref:Ig-like domain-containing protein n=1 Tax=Mycobacterium sp. EPa45 TaxID=1545728 RepID=UPI0011874FBF|nr:Ig-like domain-containing protein [Mycobacterium sp. EPa45]